MGKKDEHTQKEQQYTQELYNTLNYSNQQFDKNVLFIASGALGVSFAFIDKLVPNLENAIEKNCLINAWYWFAAVIFISMVSHFISSLSIRWRIENHKKYNVDNGVIKWNWVIRGLNILMMSGLLIGTILLINFINQNI
jgi:hypothetical protein